MPDFKKRHGRYEIRFKDSSRDPKEKTEGLPLGTSKSKLRQVQGKMNDAYFSGDWDPWKLSWQEYQRDRALKESGVVNAELTATKARSLYIKDMILQNVFKSEGTRKEYENTIKRFVRWVGRDTFTSELTPEHGLRWLKIQDITQNTRNTYGAILVQFYKYLADKGFVGRALNYRGQSQERSTKIKYLTEAQKDAMCSHYLSNRDDFVTSPRNEPPEWLDYSDLINILFYQGMRKGEIFDHKIRRRDLSLMEGTVTITGKGNKTRIVPITPPAAPYFKQALVATSRPSDNLFPLSYRAFYRILKEIAKGALGQEYDWVSPHNLRHSCGTYWVSRGARVAVVQKLLGHSSIDTTMVYAQITDDTSRNEFESVYNRQAKITKIG